MHWDVYTAAAVISGATLILLAVFGRDSAARRMLGLAVGFAFMGYGVYVAGQTSGTYYFPIVMFLIPGIGIVHFAKGLLARSRGSAQPQIGARGGASRRHRRRCWRPGAAIRADRDERAGGTADWAPRTGHRGTWGHRGRGTAGPGGIGTGGTAGPGGDGTGTGAQDQSGSAGAGPPALRSPSAPSGAGVNGSRGRVTSVRPGPSRPRSRVRFAPHPPPGRAAGCVDHPGGGQRERARDHVPSAHDREVELARHGRPARRRGRDLQLVVAQPEQMTI